MLESLKNRWLLLSPRGKTLTLWAGGFSIIVILVLGLSSKPIKAPVRVISKSEMGVFNVDDEDVTIEALGTKLKAQEAQMDLFKQQLTATNGQLLKAKEIISSMSGSDRNIRTLNELSRKVQSFDDKLNGVVEKNQYYSKNSNDQKVVIEQPVIDSKEGDSKTKPVIKRVVSPKIVKHDTDIDFMDYSAKKIPDDPLAFVRSISDHQDSHKKEKNV